MLQCYKCFKKGYISQKNAVTSRKNRVVTKNIIFGYISQKNTVTLKKNVLLQIS